MIIPGRLGTLGERLHLHQSCAGSTTVSLELLSVPTDPATKIIIKGYQRIVDGLFVIGGGFKNIYFWVIFCALFFSDSIAC